MRTELGIIDWFQIGKGVCQGCIFSSCLFNLYAEYIMWNVGLDEAQAGIKIAGRNINNLTYTDDTTLWQKVKNERASCWKWKRNVKGLNLNIQKTKIMASCPITSWQIDGETMEIVTDFLFQNHCSPEIKRCLLLDNILKSRDITLLKKVLLVKATFF